MTSGTVSTILLAKSVKQTRRNITSKGVEEMLTLYKTLIRQVLDYCVPVSRPYTKKDVTSRKKFKFKKIQKRFMKMINKYKIKSRDEPIRVFLPITD